MEEHALNATNSAEAMETLQGSGNPDIDPSGPRQDPSGPRLDPNGPRQDPSGPRQDPSGNGPRQDGHQDSLLDFSIGDSGKDPSSADPQDAGHQDSLLDFAIDSDDDHPAQQDSSQQESLLSFNIVDSGKDPSSTDQQDSLPNISIVDSGKDPSSADQQDSLPNISIGDLGKDPSSAGHQDSLLDFSISDSSKDPSPVQQNAGRHDSLLDISLDGTSKDPSPIQGPALGDPSPIQGPALGGPALGDSSNGQGQEPSGRQDPSRDAPGHSSDKDSGHDKSGNLDVECQRRPDPSREVTNRDSLDKNDATQDPHTEDSSNASDTDATKGQPVDRIVEESKKMVDASWAALDKGTKQLGGAFKSTATWVTKGAKDFKRKTQGEESPEQPVTVDSQTPPSEDGSHTPDPEPNVWLSGFTHKLAEQWNSNVAKMEEVTMKAMENTQNSVNKAMKAMDHRLQSQHQSPSDAEDSPAASDVDAPSKGEAVERMVEESKKMVDASWTALDKGTKQLGGAFKSTATWVTKGAMDFKRKTQGAESSEQPITVEDSPNKSTASVRTPVKTPKTPVKPVTPVEEEDDIFAIESDSEESAPESASSEVRTSACASKTPAVAPIGLSSFVKLTQGGVVPKADIMNSPHVARFPFRKKRAQPEAKNWWSKAMSNVVPQPLAPRLACLCINQLIVFEERGEELVCKSNICINTIKRMCYESNRPNRVEFSYRTKEKTNVYLFDDAESFIKTLQERLIALNIGMKTN